jgi:lysyl endopeptidase
MKKRLLLLSLCLLLLVPALAAAQQVGPYMPKYDTASASAKRAAAAAAAPHVAERFGLAPLAALGDSAVEAPDRIAALRAWNAARHRPLHNGFARALAAPVEVDLTADPAGAPVVARSGGMLVQSSMATLAWGASVHVTNAYRLRLHLSRVQLPAGAQLWVHGGGRTAGPFGPEVIGPDGDIWTPSIFGEDLAIDVQLPAATKAGAGRYGFVVDKVLELVELAQVDRAPGGATAKDDESCNVDASCFSSADFPAYDTARHAIAIIEFVVSGTEGGQCTGELLNDSASDGTPYMLTANHCVSTQTSAASLEAWFDDFTPSCNGPAPVFASLPESVGATLLATGSADNTSDYTLMQLDNLPSGRGFLGWNASPAATPNGTLLYRLSHPEGEPQNYVVTRADSNTPECSGVTAPDFLYSDQVTGGTFGGSSGSAAMLADGSVVGQLFGGCGVSDDCSPQQFTVDGAFDHSFPALQKFLSPGSTVPPSVCRPDKTTLCLLSRRFQVQVSWMNQFNGTSGAGSAIVGTDSTGYFFFTDASNYELIVKVLDFGTVFKVFYGELTNLMFTITITDTATGTIKTYSNTPGDCGAIDNSAFPADAGGASSSTSSTKLELLPPAPGAELSGPIEKRASCVPNSGTLCLLDRRFAVTTTWMNQFNGQQGNGGAHSLSDESGLFFFTDPTVVELVTKVVPFSDRVAFFYASVSDFQFAITVTDTVNGITKTYNNPAGTVCGGLDNDAFPP